MVAPSSGQTDPRQPREFGEFFAEIGDAGVSFEELLEAISKEAELTPLIAAARKEFVSRLEPLGLSAPLMAGALTRSEVLSSGDGQCALLARVRRVRRGEGPQVFEFATVSAGQSTDLRVAVQSCLSNELRSGSYESERMASRLDGQVGELSPNGKKLMDQEIRASSRALYDDELRSSLTSTLNVFGGNPMDEELLTATIGVEHPILVSGGEPSGSIFTRQYILTCTQCQGRHLAFDTRDAAVLATQSNPRCSMCGSAELTPDEMFTVKRSHVDALRQGLWLESLASDVLDEHAQRVWAGQMVGTNELDVLAVFAEAVWLMECKDSGFGQNDLYVAAAKAEAVGADEVVVFTTSDIHANVQQAERQMRDSGVRRRFRVRFISAKDAAELRSQLERLLSEAQNRHFRRWLTRQPDSSGLFISGQP